MKKNNLYILLLAVVIVGILLTRAENMDLDLDITSEYFAMMPSLIVIIFGVYGVNSSRRGANSFIAFIVLGIGFALMVAQLNTQGILIPDLVTANLTMSHIQLLIVIISGIVGGIFSQ